jgi:hypothetical protein
MFVRYFVELPHPVGQVEKALLDDPQAWILGAAGDASDRSGRMLAEVGFDAPGGRLDKLVEVDIGEPLRVPTKTLLPVTWRAAGMLALFPVMEAEIEVAPLGPERTQLAFNGRYRPPLGPVGRAVDKALLHRVAEATAKDFLDRAARALEERIQAAAAAG